MIKKVLFRTMVVITGLLLMLSLPCYSQGTYLNQSLNGLNWQIDKDLTVYSNSLQQLKVENKNAKQLDKNKKINYSSVFLPLNWKGDNSYGTYFELDKNNLTTSDVYWGFMIEFYGANGDIVTSKAWFNIDKNGKYSYNFDDKGWKDLYLVNLSSLSILTSRNNNEDSPYCTYGGTIVRSSLIDQIPFSEDKRKFFLNHGDISNLRGIKGIKSITIMVGSKAQVSVSNFSFNRWEISTTSNRNNIQLQKVGGVYEVPVELNGVLKINFIFDSGASDVSISPDVALTLLKTGTIRDSDWLPGAYYSFADGSTAKSARFMLRSLKIGNKTVNNVTCSIANSIQAPMLLGQSVLSQFGKYSFDYRTETLTIE